MIYFFINFYEWNQRNVQKYFDFVLWIDCKSALPICYLSSGQIIEWLLNWIVIELNFRWYCSKFNHSKKIRKSLWNLSSKISYLPIRYDNAQSLTLASIYLPLWFTLTGTHRQRLSFVWNTRSLIWFIHEL